MRNPIMRASNLLRKIRQPFLVEMNWANMSFSQEGEDIALSRMLDGVSSGFYVEIGGHHPFRFSNTYLFYRRGWRGICIDPLPGFKNLFDKHRPLDIALETGVSKIKSELVYYMFNEPALNTFDAKLAKERNGLSTYKIIEERKIHTYSLSEILDNYLPKDQEITFFSIDVEGLDIEVLQSNDWNKYKPRMIIAESLKTDLLSLAGDPIVEYLGSLGYTPLIKTGNSIIYSAP